MAEHQDARKNPDRNGEIGNSTIIVEDFNIHLSKPDRKAKQRPTRKQKMFTAPQTSRISQTPALPDPRTRLLLSAHARHTLWTDRLPGCKTSLDCAPGHSCQRKERVCSHRNLHGNAQTPDTAQMFSNR